MKQQQFLAKKVLTVIGGTGYVGINVARQALQMGATVNCVSRSGQPPAKLMEPWHEQVTWIRADSMQPEKFMDTLEQSDVVIHTVGTLFDTSITKFKSPGDIGTYEHMNRDTALSILNALESFKKRKRFIYLSASGGPPFIPRYLKTKLEVEQYALGLKHVKSTFLKPGFIFSWEHRWWSLILKYDVDLVSYLMKKVGNNVPENSMLRDFVRQFEIDKSISLDAVTTSAIVSGFNEDFDSKMIYNDEMEEIRTKYYEGKYKFQK